MVPTKLCPGDITWKIHLALNVDACSNTMGFNTKFICDRIKQKELEVGQIQFSFLTLVVYIICEAAFYSRPQ